VTGDLIGSFIILEQPLTRDTVVEVSKTEYFEKSMMLKVCRILLQFIHCFRH